MKFPNHAFTVLFYLLLCISILGCSDADKEQPVAANQTESKTPAQLVPRHVRLDDGVYPALWGNDDPREDDPKYKIVELVNIPVEGEESPPAKVRVIDAPLLHFRHVPQFDFTFQDNECTRIGFQNTDELKSYSRDHIGFRLAVVIDNHVVSVHKIREAIESDQVQITCCTEGGGDHLHNYLTELKLASKSNSLGTDD